MKGNYLVLTDDMLDFFNDRYCFDISDLGIVTKTNSYKRTVIHPFNQPFQAIGVYEGRKITFRISTKAISFWRQDKYRFMYSLIEIQNIINKLIVSNKKVTDLDIENALNR